MILALKIQNNTPYPLRNCLRKFFSRENYLGQNLKAFMLSCCCNFMQEIRKVPCIDFSLNLQNFILGPFWSLLALKLQNKFFPQKNIYVNFKLLCLCNFILHAKKKQLENLICSLICIFFGSNTSNQDFSPKNHQKLYVIVNFIMLKNHF